MIPSVGCDPDRNIVSLGAEILKVLSHSSFEINHLLVFCSERLSVSIDHIIISLDWLYMIRAIDYCDSEVFLNEAG